MCSLLPSLWSGYPSVCTLYMRVELSGLSSVSVWSMRKLDNALRRTAVVLVIDDMITCMTNISLGARLRGKGRRFPLLCRADQVIRPWPPWP